MAHGHTVARQPPRRRRGAGFFHMVGTAPRHRPDPPSSLSPPGLAHLLQLLEIEARLSGGFDDHALAGDDLVSSRSNLFRQIQWYDHGAVAVGMNEIAVSGAHPRDVDRSSKVDDMNERMRGNHTPSQHLEPFRRNRRDMLSDVTATSPICTATSLSAFASLRFTLIDRAPHREFISRVDPRAHVDGALTCR